MNCPRIHLNVPRLMALLWVAQMGLAMAQSAMPVSDPDKDDIIEALGGSPVGLPAKLFRRTHAPDALTYACPEADVRQAGGAPQKNLAVVAYAGEAAPGINLSINFATNSDKILPSSSGAIASLSGALQSQSLTGVQVAIAGHTDAQGPLKTNMELSCARALAVRAALVAQGVDGARLGVYGFGPKRPIEPGATVSAANRRVEVRRAN
jgi:outer membrane protein OmpA-like peptidoglycan-associated protein